MAGKKKLTIRHSSRKTGIDHNIARIVSYIVVMIGRLVIVLIFVLFTHAYDSRVRKAFSGIYDSVCVCVSVCPYVKTETSETKITELGTWRLDRPSRYLAHKLIVHAGQRSRSHGQKIQKGDRVAGMSYALYRMPSLWLYFVCMFFSFSAL